MRKRKTKIFVAMSGGVDSSVASALLKERGFDVHGIHMKMWSDPALPCTAKEDRLDAMRVVAKLGIPFETWDFMEEYKKAVVEYMVREYAAGKTPNPDIMCNQHIKFGLFLKRALKEGADFIATGHYVRKFQISKFASLASLKLRRSGSANSRVSPVGSKAVCFRPKSQTNSKFKIQPPKLLKAKDDGKDQSYFLWTLTQEQLRHCLFPIGEYKKTEVREMARKFGLPTAEKPDSQGVCFIGEFNMSEFLQRYIPMRPGLIVTSGGREIGEHEGLPFYTIGQRHGIGIGGGIPYYVSDKDFETNTLFVAEGPYDEKLFRKELVATDVNWISGKTPRLPLRCEARIRYRQSLQRAIITKHESGIMGNESVIHDSKFMIHVVFDEPQRAVTPGQSVVFYQGEEMLGGGAIVR